MPVTPEKKIAGGGGCFVAGTFIRTQGGDIPVENLKIGDQVLTVSGAVRPVKWLGHRTVNGGNSTSPYAIWPIRIAAGAFAPRKPLCDLLVSPKHALFVTCIDEFLIPAQALINGPTIAPVEMDEVTYWHVELDSHDVLVANGMPAESYLDTGNRSFFVECGVVSLDAGPDERRHTGADFCRPLLEAGEIVDFIRAYLFRRATELGWTACTEAGLHLAVEGVPVSPAARGGQAVFEFPASARDVRLRSSTFVPRLVTGSRDTRRLGALLSGFTLSDETGKSLTIQPDDPRLDEGCHAPERRNDQCWRWTKGDLHLDPSFWDGLTGQIELSVSHRESATRRWQPAVLQENSLVPEPVCAAG